MTLSLKPSYDSLDAAVESIGMKGAHYRIILLVALGSLFNVVEQYNIGYVAPIIIDEWGITSGQAGLLTSVTFACIDGFITAVRKAR